MIIQVRVFDEAQKEIVFYQTEINLQGLFQVAKSRAKTFREKGSAFAQGAVPFFGAEFVKAVQNNDEKAIETSAMQAAMAAWLYDSIYGDVTEAMYEGSSLQFNLHPMGMVVCNRVPKLS